MRTKFPDGQNNEQIYNNANVSGQNIFDQPATAVTIGATVGVSFVIFIVAAVLILIYLKAKTRMLKQREVEILLKF